MPARTPAALEIRWPSGTIQKIENVRADQQLEITEPAQTLLRPRLHGINGC